MPDYEINFNLRSVQVVTKRNTTD